MQLLTRAAAHKTNKTALTTTNGDLSGKQPQAHGEASRLGRTGPHALHRRRRQSKLHALRSLPW